MTSSSTSARPTPAIPKGGHFSIYAETEIQASAKVIIDALVDISTWHDWNTFVHSVKLLENGEAQQQTAQTDIARLQNGSRMQLKVNMGDASPASTTEIVTVLEAPREDGPGDIGQVFRVCWKLDNSILVPHGMLHAERVNEVEVGQNGSCIYRTWETFGGPLARVVKWKYNTVLQARFEDWARDLKKFVESGQATNVRAT